MKTEPEAIVEVWFLTTAEGGKTKAPVDAFEYRATFQIDNDYHDGRFMAAGLHMELGVPCEVPVKFLRPDLVLPKLVEGKRFTLWEGKLVATAKVVRVCAQQLCWNQSERLDAKEDARAEPEAVIEVRFLTATEGGKKSTPVLGSGYGATFQIDDERYDGYFLAGGLPMQPGITYAVPVAFLRSEIVVPKLAKGKRLALYEGGELVASGKIVRVLTE